MMMLDVFVVTGFVPRLWVMTLWKIFAVDTQFKQLRKRSLKKKFRLQRDSNPWPLRYRCSALPTELWSHNCWEQVNFSGSIMPLRVIQHYSDWVVPRLWVMTLWKIFAVDTQFKQLRKRSLKKNSGFSGNRTRDLCDTGAVLYQLSYEAITVGSRSILVGPSCY